MSPEPSQTHITRPDYTCWTPLRASLNDTGQPDAAASVILTNQRRPYGWRSNLGIQACIAAARS